MFFRIVGLVLFVGFALYVRELAATNVERSLMVPEAQVEAQELVAYCENVTQRMFEFEELVYADLKANTPSLERLGTRMAYDREMDAHRNVVGALSKRTQNCCPLVHREVLGDASKIRSVSSVASQIARVRPFFQQMETFLDSVNTPESRMQWLVEVLNVNRNNNLYPSIGGFPSELENCFGLDW